MRRVLFVLSLASTVVLGVERTGAFSFVDDTRSGLAIERVEERVYRLEKEGARQGTRVVLRLDARLGDLADVRAELEDGAAEVAAFAEADPAGGTRITVCGRTQAPDERAFFPWPPGSTLRVWTEAGPALPAEIEDWEVHLADEGIDTRAKTRRRTQWAWASALLLLLSVGGAAGTMPRRFARTREDLTGYCRESIVRMIDDGTQRNAALRKINRKFFIEGASEEEAVAWMRRTRPSQRKLLFVLATGYYDRRRRLLAEDLGLVLAEPLEEDAT